MLSARRSRGKELLLAGMSQPPRDLFPRDLPRKAPAPSSWARLHVVVKWRSWHQVVYLENCSVAKTSASLQEQCVRPKRRFLGASHEGAVAAVTIPAAGQQRCSMASKSSSLPERASHTIHYLVVFECRAGRSHPFQSPYQYLITEGSSLQTLGGVCNFCSGSKVQQCW